MAIDTSHIWKQLKRGTMREWGCYVCGLIIPKGTKGVWKYDQPHRLEYAHDDCFINMRKSI